MAIILGKLSNVIHLTDQLLDKYGTSYAKCFPMRIDWAQVVLSGQCGDEPVEDARIFENAPQFVLPTGNAIPLRLLNRRLQSYKIDLDPVPQLHELRVGGIPWNKAYDRVADGEWAQHDAWVVLGSMPMTSIVVGYYY